MRLDKYLHDLGFGSRKEIDHLLAQPETMERMRQNMLHLGISDSASRVAEELINIIKK